VILSGLNDCYSDPVSLMSRTAAVGCILVPGRMIASFHIDGYLNVTYGLATKDMAPSEAGEAGQNRLCRRADLCKERNDALGRPRCVVALRQDV
jgi:hypothetical protein